MLRNRKKGKAVLVPPLLDRIFILRIHTKLVGTLAKNKNDQCKPVLFYPYHLPILLFHLISVVLFPNFNTTANVDLKDFFFKNTRWLFSLFATYFAFTILSSFIYPDVGDIQTQNIIRGVGVLLSCVAAVYHKNTIIHNTFLALEILH